MSTLSVDMWNRAPDYPVNLDFMPSINLQAKLDPKQELYFAGMIVSYGRKSPPAAFKEAKKGSYKRVGDLGAKVKRLSGTSLEIKFGSNNPLDQTVMTHLEMAKEITAVWQPPTSIIKKCGTIDKITKLLEKRSELDGVNSIYSRHNSIANRPNYIRNRLNFTGIGTYRLTNTHQELKLDFLKRNIIFPDLKEDLKRIRSFLVNQSLLTDTKVGYDSLYPIKHIVQKELRKKRFWKDTAIPMTFRGDLDGIKNLGMTICKLDVRNNKLIVI